MGGHLNAERYGYGFSPYGGQLTQNERMNQQYGMNPPGYHAEMVAAIEQAKDQQAQQASQALQSFESQHALAPAGLTRKWLLIGIALSAVYYIGKNLLK